MELPTSEDWTFDLQTERASSGDVWTDRQGKPGKAGEGEVE